VISSPAEPGDTYDAGMARLVLLNGAPGVGKSTISALVAGRLPRAIAIDVDDLKHALPSWPSDRKAAGRLARAQAVETAREQLAAGSDVVIAQYVARSDFVDELEAGAGDLGASFHELVLMVPASELRRRIAERSATDEPRKEGPIAPSDATALIEALNAFVQQRPRADTVDASGSQEQTVANVIEALEHGDPEDGS